MSEQVMNTPAESSKVYVRYVPLGDLPRKLRKEAREGGLEGVYALHREDGAQMALVGDREMAFVLARQHDLEPVSVH
jgi:hypothetical protein